MSTKCKNRDPDNKPTINAIFFGKRGLDLIKTFDIQSCLSSFNFLLFYFHIKHYINIWCTKRLWCFKIDNLPPQSLPSRILSADVWCRCFLFGYPISYTLNDTTELLISNRLFYYLLYTLNNYTVLTRQYQFLDQYSTLLKSLVLLHISCFPSVQKIYIYWYIKKHIV